MSYPSEDLLGSNPKRPALPLAWVQGQTMNHLRHPSLCTRCTQLAEKNAKIQRALNHFHHALVYKDVQIQKLTTDLQRREITSQAETKEIERLQKQQDDLETVQKALKSQNEEMVRKLEQMKQEQECLPARPPLPIPPPPPPPPPAMRVLGKLIPWKNGKYQRSKSMSRIDDFKQRRNPSIMVLNEGILDAIRNKTYALKHVTDPEEDAKKRLTAKRRQRCLSMVHDRVHHSDDMIVARILERRMKMAYDDPDSNGEPTVNPGSDRSSSPDFEGEDPTLTPMDKKRISRNIQSL